MLIIPVEVSVEQSLGGHSVGSGQVGQVTSGQGVGGWVVGQVGQVTGGGHVGQVVGGRQVGQVRVGHAPQQLSQAAQVVGEEVVWEFASAEARD